MKKSFVFSAFSLHYGFWSPVPMGGASNNKARLMMAGFIIRIRFIYAFTSPILTVSSPAAASIPPAGSSQDQDEVRVSCIR